MLGLLDGSPDGEPVGGSGRVNGGGPGGVPTGVPSGGKTEDLKMTRRSRTSLLSSNGGQDNIATVNAKGQRRRKVKICTNWPR